MKKVIKKLNKTLSVLLAAAMIVGSVPDVALVAQAEELTEESKHNCSSEGSNLSKGICITGSSYRQGTLCSNQGTKDTSRA